MKLNARLSYALMAAPPAFLVLEPFFTLLFMHGGGFSFGRFLMELPFAYILFGLPAIASSFVYCALCLGHRLLLPERDIGLVLSAAMGALSGLMGMMVFAVVFRQSGFLNFWKEANFYTIGSAAGTTCSVFVSALVSTWIPGRTSSNCQDVKTK